MPNLCSVVVIWTVSRDLASLYLLLATVLNSVAYLLFVCLQTSLSLLDMTSVVVFVICKPEAR